MHPAPLGALSTAQPSPQRVRVYVARDGDDHAHVEVVAMLTAPTLSSDLVPARVDLGEYVEDDRFIASPLRHGSTSMSEDVPLRTLLVARTARYSSAKLLIIRTAEARKHRRHDNLMEGQDGSEIDATE